MSACTSEPSEAAVIETAPIEVKTKLYRAACWTGFCPPGLPTLGIEIILLQSLGGSFRTDLQYNDIQSGFTVELRTTEELKLSTPILWNEH